MLVQVGLCRTCSETTLLVFPRGGSFVSMTTLTSNIDLSLSVDETLDLENLQKKPDFSQKYNEKEMFLVPGSIYETIDYL